MKRITIAIALLFLFAASDRKTTNPTVTRSLLAALQNERAAAVRYEAFAVKAAEEGYPGAAALFRAEARAEQVHASRFETFLQSRGIDVPAADPPKPSVSSTADNIRAALMAEQGERDGSYLVAFNEAQSVGDSEAAKLFDTTRDAEVEHLNLDKEASNHLDKLKEPKTFYVCDICGYTTDLKLPLCPSCRGQHEMETFK